MHNLASALAQRALLLQAEQGLLKRECLMYYIENNQLTVWTVTYLWWRTEDKAINQSTITVNQGRTQVATRGGGGQGYKWVATKGGE